MAENSQNNRDIILYQNGIYWYFTENKTLLSSWKVVGKNVNVYRENVLLRLIHFIQLKFYFYSFFKFKLFYHPNCRRCSKTLLLHYVEYLLPNKYTFKCEKIFMWHMHFFKQVVQLAVFSVWCMHVCVCVCVCVCFYCIWYFWCSPDNSPIWNSIIKYLLQIEVRYRCFWRFN